MTRSIILCSFVQLIVVAFATRWSTAATTLVWTPKQTVSTPDWADPRNWNMGVQPRASTDVARVDNGVIGDIKVSIDVSIQAIQVGNSDVRLIPGRQVDFALQQLSIGDIPNATGRLELDPS